MDHHFPYDGRHEGEIDDHYPLTVAGVRELLEIARASDGWQERNSIQIRLSQAIPGCTCPRSDAQDFYQREAAMAELYLGAVRSGDWPADLAERIHAALHGRAP